MLVISALNFRGEIINI